MDWSILRRWRVLALLLLAWRLRRGPFGRRRLAQAVGAPRPWEMGMQPAFGPVKEQKIELHDLVLVIITLITLFVGGLLVWVM